MVDMTDPIKRLVEDLARPIHNFRMAHAIRTYTNPPLEKSARTREANSRVEIEYAARAWLRDHPEPSEEFKRAWPNWPEEDGRATEAPSSRS